MLKINGISHHIYILTKRTGFTLGALTLKGTVHYTEALNIQNGREIDFSILSGDCIISFVVSLFVAGMLAS